jgi:cryptochrome
VPTLAEMGIPAATTSIRRGETLTLSKLAELCSDSAYIGTFEKPKSAPTDCEPQPTTLLSPHLHFGSLSVREFWWRVQEVIAERKKKKQHVSDIPVNLPGPLLFRDMYFGAHAVLGDFFAQEARNKICRFVDWHLRSHVSDTPIGEHLLGGTYTVDSPQAEEWFQRWKFGRTGFPWIDALMRQLRREGWIHHMGRHAVACFLTRGGCYVHWGRGAEVFEEWLVDHETACNVDNWMWLSCMAFLSIFYRVYSPVAFGRKTDTEGKFVKHFVPELEHYDHKYIYEPWKAPIADQREVEILD